MSTGSKEPRPEGASGHALKPDDKATPEHERRPEAPESPLPGLSINDADGQSPWRSPLIIAIVAAALAAAGNALVTYMNADSQARLEQVKAEQNLIIEAIKTGGDVEQAAANLSFLVDTGLVTDRGRSDRIKAYMHDNRNRPDRKPALPSEGQTQPPAPRPRTDPSGEAAPARVRPVPPSSSARGEVRMAALQLIATPSDGLQRFQLHVDGRDVQLGADNRAQIQIPGACGDRSVHRLAYTLVGPAGATLSVAISCGGNAISRTGPLTVSEASQPFAAGWYEFRL